MAYSLARLVPYQCTGSLPCNVSKTERWITGVVGGAIAAAGVAQLVRRRSAAADADRQPDTGSDSRTTTALALVAGGALLARATSGFCPVYALIGRGSHDADWRARTRRRNERSSSPLRAEFDPSCPKGLTRRSWSSQMERSWKD
jgi:hypothetical protein